VRGLRAFSLALAAPFKRRHAERAEFIPARLTREGRVEPIAYHGSAHLLALTRADGFFSLPAGTTELAAGEVVEFLMLPEHSQ
jgi:molybdopterin biosynthesis enzyme